MGGKTLEWVSQRSYECPGIGIVQGRVGWGSTQPDLVKDTTGHGRGVGLCNP